MSKTGLYSEEIEITPEMIEAGAAILYEDGGHGFVDDFTLARQIFQAMALARNAPSCPEFERQE